MEVFQRESVSRMSVIIQFKNGGWLCSTSTGVRCCKAHRIIAVSLSEPSLAIDQATKSMLKNAINHKKDDALL